MLKLTKSEWKLVTYALYVAHRDELLLADCWKPQYGKPNADAKKIIRKAQSDAAKLKRLRDKILASNSRSGSEAR